MTATYADLIAAIEQRSAALKNITGPMATVRVVTSDTAWIGRHGLTPAVLDGKDCKGREFYATTIERPVEHTKFGGKDMIRFDLGDDAPRDHNRWAQVPASWLVSA